MRSRFLVFLSVLFLVVAGATISASAYQVFDDYGGTFYDANKSVLSGDHPDYTPAGDALMCWAASASNALFWTGWDGGFASEALIFDHYIAHFTNKGLYSALWGAQWFFDGVSRDPTWGVATTDGSGGGFYTSENIWGYAGYLDNGDGTGATDLAILQGMNSWLHDGSGVMLNIATQTDDGWLGHAITVWGYEQTGGEYTSLWITDPDSPYDYYTEPEGLIQVAINQSNGLLPDYLTGVWEITGAQYLALTPGFDPSRPGPGPGSEVPEPATMFLLGTGLIGLAGFRKKFKK